MFLFFLADGLIKQFPNTINREASICLFILTANKLEQGKGNDTNLVYWTLPSQTVDLLVTIINNLNDSRISLKKTDFSFLFFSFFYFVVSVFI